MKIAITGATGCIGRPLMDKLISDGAYLKVLILPDDSAPNYTDNKVEIITGDLGSPEALTMLCQDCDVVFHLAGMVHSVPGTKSEEQKFYQVNVEGTRKLLQAANENRVKRIVFSSTVGVYGKNSDFHGDELSPCKPWSVYAESKYQAEQLILNRSHNDKPEGVVLRFPVVYGPLDRGNVAKLIKAVNRKIFFHFGDGNCLRSMISSKNAAAAMVRAAYEPMAAGEIFCVTDGIDYTMNTLVDSICRTMKLKRRPFHVPVFFADLVGNFGDIVRMGSFFSFPLDSDRIRKLSRSLTFSCAKAKKILGYMPVEKLEEGIKSEVRWLYPSIADKD